MQILHVGSRVLDAVSNSFSPSAGATPREVRINGAICVGLGILIMAIFFASAIFLPANWLDRAFLVPAFLVYALWLVGGFRLVFGASARPGGGVFASLQRIVFGITFIIAMGGLLVGMAWVAQHLAAYF